MSKKDQHPLALNNTLRDLALLRASDIDLKELCRSCTTASQREGPAAVENSVLKSYQFTEEARKALKIHNSGQVQGQGERVDKLREGLDQLSEGLAQA